MRRKNHLLTKILLSIFLISVGIFTSWNLMAKEGGKFWYTRPKWKTPPKIIAYDFSQLVKRVTPAVFNLYVESRPKMERHFQMRKMPRLPWDEWGFPLPKNFQGRRYFRRWIRRAPIRLSRGSGFLINEQGYALTNHHVVRDASKIRAELADGRIFNVKVVGQSELLDVALIKLISKKRIRFPYIYLGDSQKLKVGEPVIAIGNARGLGISVTAGIVSAKGRVIHSPYSRRMSYDNYIQTDAAINKGNSGGPLFNSKGEVIGINTAILRGGRGIGFAIPINVIRMVLPQLKTKGRIQRAKLGVYIQRMTPSLARTFGLEIPQGALVSKVVPGSAADKAGIKQGDIILEFNGIKIKKDSQLPFLVAFNPPGTKARLLILRNHRKIHLTVTLQAWGQSFTDTTTTPSRGKNDGSAHPADNHDAKALTRLGVGVSTISPSLRQRLNLPKVGGLRIVNIRPNSPAAENGLRRGDIIMEVNRKLIKTPKDLIKQISKVPHGEDILLLIRRDDSSLFLAFTLP